MKEPPLYPTVISDDLTDKCEVFGSLKFILNRGPILEEGWKNKVLEPLVSIYLEQYGRPGLQNHFICRIKYTQLKHWASDNLITWFSKKSKTWRVTLLNDSKTNMSPTVRVENTLTFSKQTVDLDYIIAWLVSYAKSLHACKELFDEQRTELQEQKPLLLPSNTQPPETHA